MVRWRPRSRRISALLVLVTVCLAGAVRAGDPPGETYECAMRSQGSGGWIGPVMFLTIDRGSERGVVMDAVIYAAHGIPIEVDTTRRSDTLWVFRWTVEDVPMLNEGSGTVRYRASLNTATRKVRVTGVLLGYDNNISGSGDCRDIG